MTTAAASPTAPASRSEEFLAEFFDSRGRKLTVDREASTVSGVKLMGIESKNRRRFSAEALKNIFELSDGAKINVNHNSRDLSAPRDYGDRIGSVISRTLESDGIYGTIKINPKHPLAEQFFWDAENAPQNCGMSPVYAPHKTSRAKDGFLLVESVAKVSSIDLVADPATTNSLKESQGDNSMSEQLLAEALKAKSDLEGQVTKLTEQVGKLEGEKKSLSESVATLTAEKQKGERAAAVTKFIAEAKLPSDSVSAETRELWESVEVDKAEKLVKNFAEAFNTGRAKPKSDFDGGNGSGGGSSGENSGQFDSKKFANNLLKR